MKNYKKGFVIPLAIVIIAILVLGGGYYFAKKSGFITDNRPSDILQPETIFRDTLTKGTPEQKEKALDEIRYKVEKYNVATIPQEEQTKISEITLFIPYVIEAILDSTSLPRHEDTGWGNVSHYANTIMNMFAYRFDGVQRAKDPKFSFNDIGLPTDEAGRKFVHDNWLNWWNENKNIQNYKTYKNEEYGFEIKYPQGLFIREYTDPVTGTINATILLTQKPDMPDIRYEDNCKTYPDYIKIVITPNFKVVLGKSVEQFIQNQTSNIRLQGGEKISDQTIGPLRKVAFSVAPPYGQTYDIFSESTLYTIEYRKCSGQSMPLEKIISTFNIID